MVILILFRNKHFKRIFTIFIALTTFFLSGCDAIDDAIDDALAKSEPSIILLSGEYRLNVIDVKYFNVNNITLDDERVVNSNITKVGWNKKYIYFEYDDVETSKRGTGYIDVKTGSIMKNESEIAEVEIMKKVGKINLLTPRKLYQQKHKKIYGK